MVGPVLQIENLSKEVGKKKILHDINFEVFQGEVFGLLGPNGAGKTTIIRSIVSLIRRSSGTILIKGKDVGADFKTTISEIGAIIENPEFYMYLSGWENLKQFARMSRKDISENQLKEVVALVKMSDAIHEKVKTYSLGMRQRLGLAQALLHHPSILILDEPTNGLDPQGMAEFREIIRNLSAQGTSVLISSHLLSEVQQITDRFAIIDKGKLTHIEKISDVEEEAHSKYFFKVSDEAAADLVFHSLDLESKNSENNCLEVVVAEQQVPQVIKALVDHQVEIYAVFAKAASLEERFLELTNGGKSL